MAHPLRRLVAHFEHHRGRVVAAILCSVVNKIFDLAPPVLIGMAIDIVVKRDDAWIAAWTGPELMHQLSALAGLTVLIWALESVFEYAYGVLWRNLAQTVQHELRIDGYRHVQSLELAYFADESTGNLMSILNDDVNQLERFLDTGANEALQVTTTVVVVGWMYFGISPTIAMLAFLPVPFVLWGSFRFQARIAPRYQAVRERVAKLNAALSNNLSGIVTIKSFTAEKREIDRVSERSNAYRDANREAIKLSSAFSPLIRMVIVVGFTATLVVGGQLVNDGTLEVGAYSVLIFLTQRLLWPLTRLGSTFDLYQRAMASTKRILNLLDIKPQLISGTRTLPSDIGGEVRFESVCFGYTPTQPILRDLSVVIAAGKTTAIVGPTGSGKSTFIRLLLRFYDPQKGQITLDGIDLKDLEIQSVRESIALVYQDVFLFDGSVRENIAYGCPDAPKEAIRDAARAAEAHSFIEQLPEQYETDVGERGQKLSGGQRQRISLARAILKSAPIIVLDEATSSVDNETEVAIQRSLARISKTRTTVVIAHRLSTITTADHIIVFEDGSVAEQGTHAELLTKEGLYWRLWSSQQLEEFAA